MHGGVSVADHLGGQFNPCKHRHTHRESDHPLYGNRDLKPQVGVALQCLLQDRNLLVAEGLDKQLRLPGRFLTALRSGLSQVHCVEGLGDRRRCSLGSNKKHGTAQKNDTHQLIRPHIILKFAHEIKQACWYHAYSRT